MKMMKRISTVMAAAAFALSAGQADAAILVESDMASKGLTTTNWSDTLTVNKYSGSFGPLVAVKVILSGDVEGDAKYESLDASPAVVNLNVAATVQVSHGLLGNIIQVIPLANQVDNPTAFDGAIDFGGTSGNAYTGLTGTDTDSVTLNSLLALATFTGPGTISLNADGTGNSTGSGAGNLLLQFATTAGAKVTVEYYVDRIVPVPAALPAGLALVGLMGLRRSRKA